MSIKYEWKREEVPKNIEVKQVYAVIFLDDGRILLRVEDEKYKLTGGKPESTDENYIETIKRECFEELNIELYDIYYLGYQLVTEKELKKPYAQVRMIGKLKSIGKNRKDLDTGKIYKRFLANLDNVKKYLNYLDDCGNELIDDAILMAKEKYEFKRIDRMNILYK